MLVCSDILKPLEVSASDYAELTQVRTFYTIEFRFLGLQFSCSHKNSAERGVIS